MLSVTDRFIEAYNYLLKEKAVANAMDFAKTIGISSSMLTEIKKGRSQIGVKALQNTVLKFPIFNSHWLLTGEGRMLIEGEKGAYTPTATDLIDTERPHQKHLPPIPGEGFDRKFDRNLTGKEVNTPENTLKPDVQKCYKCEAKDEVISTKDMLIETLRSKDKLSEAYLKEKDRTIQSLEQQKAELVQLLAQKEKRAG